VASAAPPSSHSSVVRRVYAINRRGGARATLLHHPFIQKHLHLRARSLVRSGTTEIPTHHHHRSKSALAVSPVMRGPTRSNPSRLISRSGIHSPSTHTNAYSILFTSNRSLAVRPKRGEPPIRILASTCFQYGRERPART